MLKVPSLRKIKYGKNKVIQAQAVEYDFIFDLEYRYAVLSRGMQRWLIDNKSSHRFIQVRILKKNPWLLTMSNLVDQVLG
jgi:hypothetical protein